MATAQPARLIDVETRLVEQYMGVPDFVSRCAQAIDTGNWFYPYHKASELEGAAGRLTDIAGETCREIRAGKPQPRTVAMRAAVAHVGRHYRAARPLHPDQPDQRELEGGGAR